ncbi:MAG: DMT family transporter [Arenicella sp.]|nr:DMT family transporter [Arenicella sp.]
MKKPILVNFVLLFIAVIWGVGFVPQKLGMQYLGPAAFNALRFALGALTLVPVMLLMKSVSRSDFINQPTLVMAFLLGSLLFGGALLQQIGLQYTSIANVSFITGLYVIVVPLIGYFLGYRYGLIVWGGGIIAVAGLYLMTSGGDMGSVKGDLIAMVGAVLWAMHLMLIAEKAAKFNQIVLSFFQFVFCALLSLVVAALYESKILPTEVRGYLWPLVNGIVVVGAAYTLQVIIMDHAEPFSAALILSLEAVFGAIAGYLWLSEQLGLAALVGAAMMLLGCLLAQVPSTTKKRLER